MNKLFKNYLIDMLSLAVALGVPISVLTETGIINLDQMMIITVFQGITIGLYLGVKLLIALKSIEKKDKNGENKI